MFIDHDIGCKDLMTVLLIATSSQAAYNGNLRSLREILFYELSRLPKTHTVYEISILIAIPLEPPVDSQCVTGYGHIIIRTALSYLRITD
jgi:hypothetical protein